MIFVYILLGIVALFIAMQLMIVQAAKKSKGMKLQGLSGKLKQLEKAGAKGLVYFYSPNCRACIAQTPVIKALQKDYPNVYDVNVAQDRASMTTFGIKATPTTMWVEDGEVKQVFVGAKPAGFFVSLLK